MAQEPKRRHSKSRKRTRRAAIMLKNTALISCPNCGKPLLPHIACKNCGFYKGKTVQASKVQITKV
ncbi:MAG: 50S ribosomal protein L32 [Candidatus Daviesbacteria bacterium]|nr:MAG: 50S ribosomal protein L32 [Candidatus Daviesbacteria bacterium]